MHSLDTLTLEQIDAMMVELRTRRKTLRSSGIANQRKIVTLARRRERLLAQVQTIDAQITQLRRQPEDETPLVRAQYRTRRRRVCVEDYIAAILVCVGQHSITKRATIVEECHLTPTNASIYLRQLCREGRLVRQGEKNSATYTLPENNGC